MADEKICDLLDKIKGELKKELEATIGGVEHTISVSGIEVGVSIEPHSGTITLRVRKWLDNDKKRTAKLDIRINELPITKPGSEYNEFYLELARRPIETSRPSEDLT